MSYTKTEWKARKGSNLKRFEKDRESSISVELHNAPNAITQEGTPFSEANMNHIEEGIFDAHELIAAEEQARIGADALKQDKLNRTVGGNDNATGTVNDTGGNLSVPISVTVAAPAASNTQTTAGTRSLRAQLKILIDNIASLFSRTGTVEGKIPTQATTFNQLADKDFVNSSIQNMAARYVTPTAAMNTQWASFAALQAGPYFINGVSGTPSNNDYAIFTETDNSVWRAKYVGSAWSKQYKVNDTPFNAAQLAAINSNITAELVADYNEHLADTNNPHSVTKEQVGLGNVDNIQQATKTEFNTHNNDIIKHVTQTEKNYWNAGGASITGTLNVATATAVGTTSKVVNSVPGGEPTAGRLVLVTFTNGNTAMSPTLNIRSGTSGGTARPIWFNGAQIVGSAGNPGNYAAGARVLFYFNGAQYEQIAINTNFDAIVKIRNSNIISDLNDLNSLPDCGFYYRTGGTNPQNVPSGIGIAWTLLVELHGRATMDNVRYGVKQTITDRANSRTWIRTSETSTGSNGAPQNTWSPWQEQVFFNNRLELRNPNDGLNNSNIFNNPPLANMARATYFFVNYATPIPNAPENDDSEFHTLMLNSNNLRVAQLIMSNNQRIYYRQYYNYWMDFRELAFLIPITNGVQDFGNPSYRYKDIYITGVINSSDEREKKNINPLNNIKDIFMALNPVSYKFKNGTSGRTHHGLIAQEVEDAMLENGLTDMDFAGLIKSPKYEAETRLIPHEVTVPAKKDEETGEIIEPEHVEVQYVTEKIPTEERVIADHIYGLRYSEFIPMLIKMVQDQQKTIDSLTARINALETSFLHGE